MLVRCVVCGEVFDDSELVCPVCGAGPESFVPVSSPSKDSAGSTSRRFVILGGGAAAVNAALAIRNADEGAAISLYSNEAYLPYNRPMLTKGLLGDLSEERLAIHDRAFYKQMRIDVHLGMEAFSIQRDMKAIIFTDSSAAFYDKLVYAMGSNAFIPPIEGSKNSNVFSIRSLDDARSLKARLGQAHKAVVIGAGVLGLEAAWAFSQAGIETCVLDNAAVLLAGKIDLRFSEALAKKALEHKVTILPSASAVRINEDSVELADSRRLEADLVVISTGVRARSLIAQLAGLEVQRAVVVDKLFRTSDPDILACGDCAQCDGVSSSLWSQAVAQAQAAGQSAATGSCAAIGTPVYPMTLSAFSTTLFTVGKKTEDSRLESLNGNMCAYYYEDSKLVGATLLGNVGKEISYVIRTMNL